MGREKGGPHDHFNLLFFFLTFSNFVIILCQSKNKECNCFLAKKCSDICKQKGLHKICILIHYSIFCITDFVLKISVNISTINILSIYLYNYLFFYLPVCLSIYLSFYLSIYLSDEDLTTHQTD